VKIAITSTDMVTDVNGVRVRVWNGITERGVKCRVFVHMLRTNADADVAEFEAELKAQPSPIPDRYIDMRHIL